MTIWINKISFITAYDVLLFLLFNPPSDVVTTVVVSPEVVVSIVVSTGVVVFVPAVVVSVAVVVVASVEAMSESSTHLENIKFYIKRPKGFFL